VTHVTKIVVTAITISRVMHGTIHLVTTDTDTEDLDAAQSTRSFQASGMTGDLGGGETDASEEGDAEEAGGKGG
jgi:hypothetical protein